MTDRERILAVLRGDECDRIPWIPRLDIWHRANKAQGTLPKEFVELDLSAIVDALGVGYHAVIPDFTAVDSPEDNLHRGLGVYNLPAQPVKTRFPGITWKETRLDDGTRRVEYDTPAGKLECAFTLTREMLDSGITIPHIQEHIVKTPEDLLAVGELFRNAETEVDESGYQVYNRLVGDRGIAVAFISVAGSPMHHIMHDLMAYEPFYFAGYDAPEELASCAKGIGEYYRKLMRSSLECSAEVYFFGSNYDSTITYPRFFEEDILPSTKKFAGILHEKEKHLMAHTDSENEGLIDHYLASDMDVADSICPAPMTKYSIGEYLDRFKGKISVMGGIPSVSLLPDSLNDRGFEEFLDRFFEELGDGRGIILGVSDTTPPGAPIERLEMIAERARDFGSVPVGR